MSGTYRDDIHSAHARIDDLTRQRDELAATVVEMSEEIASKKKERKRMKCPKCGGRFHRLKELSGVTFFASFAVAIVIALTALTWKGCDEQGFSGVCYIEAGDGFSFKLYKEYDWGFDSKIGSYRSVDEAIEDARKLGCEEIE